MKSYNTEKRANVPISQELRQKLKQRAAIEGKSMKEYLETLLEEHWKNEKQSEPDT